MAACLPVSAVVLAAGAATRMGKLKQLLPYRGRTLIQHAVDQALQAGFDPVVVVVGARVRSRPVRRGEPKDRSCGESLLANRNGIFYLCRHARAER